MSCFFELAGGNIVSISSADEVGQSTSLLENHALQESCIRATRKVHAVRPNA